MDDPNDLSQRDLSDVPDEDLTPEERQELQRRLDEFVERMQLRRLGKPEPPAKPKARRIARWDPATISRRH